MSKFQVHRYSSRESKIRRRLSSFSNRAGRFASGISQTCGGNVDGGLVSTAVGQRRHPGRAVEKRRKMALVGAAHGQRDFGYRQIRSPKKLLGARQAALDYVLVRRKPGRLLENVREMIWV